MNLAACMDWQGSGMSVHYCILSRFLLFASGLSCIFMFFFLHAKSADAQDDPGVRDSYLCRYVKVPVA